MKAFHWKKVKVFLLSGVMALAAAFCATLAISFASPITANAATLSDTQYETDGASIRVFKRTLDENNNNVYEATEKKGIRFHVQMGDGYKANGTTLFDGATKNDFNGSFKMADGFKTYTLIIPTHLIPTGEALDWDLSNAADTKVMKLDTTQYWFKDGDGNYESVAYVYNLPKSVYTKNLSFCGVICDSNDNVIAQTTVSERCLVEIAKLAYEDTIDEADYYWGTEALDETAAPLIKAFIPIYTITYTDANGATLATEEVMWGDAPSKVPTVTVDNSGNIEKSAAWYDKETSEEVDVTEALTYTESQTFTLTSSTSAEFGLTGVADYNNFTYEGTTYSGAKVYATLPVLDFYTEEEKATETSKMVPLDAKAVNVEHKRGEEILDDGFELQGVWTLKEGVNEGAQIRLVFAFDSATLTSGDQIVIKGDSVFYANGVMYKLTEDYVIDYTLNGDVEDYGIFLGYLDNSSIKSIVNWIEPTDATRLRLRATFYDDLLINSDFEFVNDSLSDAYAYPAYILASDGEKGVAPATPKSGAAREIPGGYYYWNEGANTILEFKGTDATNNYPLQGADGEWLYIAPDTKVVQNGGYYIFKEEIFAYCNGTSWVIGAEKGTFGANAFEVKGQNYTDGTQEVRFTTNSNTSLTVGGTTDRWLDEVYYLDVENMSTTEPYGVYATAPDGTVTPITTFIYHGQPYDDGTGYNHIFALKDYIGTEAGETVTIIKGTRFWYGSDYFTATEDIIFYFNGECWLVGHNGTADYTVTASDFSGKNYNYFESSKNKMRMHFTSEMFGGGTGPLYLESGDVTVNGISYSKALHYHGNGNMIFEIIGGEEKAIGANAFSDTLIIEEGTRIWIGIPSGQTATPYCLEFTETIEWRYVGDGMQDGARNPLKHEWVIPNNTDITGADIVNAHNVIDSAGGEVRLKLVDGILTDDFYGFMAVDTSKGIPVVNGIEMPKYSFAYNQSNDLLAVRNYQYGVNNSDYIMIPAGSMWWTTQGSLTFTEEIFYTYVNGNWVKGDYRAIANVTANNATVSGVEYIYAGQACSFTVTPNGTYTVSSVTVNGTPLALTANNTYTFTAVAGNNEIVVETVEGYNVTFSIEDGATVDNGAITNGTIKAVANGQELTFTVAVESGYSLGAVTGATNNGDGTYTVSAAATVMITTVKQWTVNYTIPANVTATFNGASVSGSGSVVVDEGTYEAVVSANAGYILNTVSANDTPLTANGDEYSVNVNGDIQLTATVIDPINVNNSMITRVQIYNSDTQSFRIYFDQTNTEITALTGGNYGISLNGSLSLTLGGASVTPTQYNYFGLIDGTHHQLLEVVCDITKVQAGDGLTIAAGSYFYLSALDKYIYFDEEYSFECYTVTATTSGGVTVDATSKVGPAGGNVTFTLTVPENATIKANGTEIYAYNTTDNGTCTYTVNVTGNTTVAFTTWYQVTIVDDGGSATLTYSNSSDGSSGTVTSEQFYQEGTVLTFTEISYRYTSDQSCKIGNSNKSYVVNDTYTVKGKTEIKVSSSSSCLVEGTLVTLADGTKKAVEDLKVGDNLLVFNHETGEWDTAPMFLIVHGDIPRQMWNVMNLNFSNGNVLRIVWEHGLFNKTLNQYVYINESNVNEFVGHEFASVKYINGIAVTEYVTLDSVMITQEYVKVYTPDSAYHMNVVAEDMLTITPFIIPNLFEFDEDMKYDEGQMQADIALYGLYTYEDFAEYITEEEFELFPFAYYKVAVGKGWITYEEIVAIVQNFYL